MAVIDFYMPMFLCVDCVSASLRIAQADFGRRTPHSEVVLSQLVSEQP
jgi:hypothetical protein